MMVPTPGPSPELPAILRDRDLNTTSQQQPNTPMPVAGQLQQELLQVELDMERIRGLHPKEDVPEHFITTEQLQADLAAKLAEEYTEEDERLDELEYWLLRLTPQRLTSLRGIAGDLLGASVTGYYQPEDKSLFVVGSADRLLPMARQTLAHEYVHSLQDQHFDLGGGADRVRGNSDRAMAYDALIEGDATLSASLYAAQSMSTADNSEVARQAADIATRLADFPTVLREQLAFPYTTGSQFVRILYDHGGFDAVNRALTSPPSSTEQVLHPQKYLESPRDEPLPVGVPPLTGTLGTGWHYRESDTFGELDVILMLHENGVAQPARAAAGWGGGQYDLYENGPNALVILGTRWDSGTEADEFEGALRNSLATTAQFGQFWTDGTRYFTIKRTPDRVFYIAGTERTVVQQAPSAIK
jgi:hypothetical protein